MNFRLIAVIVLSLVFANDAQEVNLRDNVFHPATDVEINKINWKKVSLSEEIENHDQRLKQSFYAFPNKEVNASDLKNRISFNIEDYAEDVDAKAIDWDNLGNCLDEIGIWLGDIGKGELYALQMIDSWGTREGGILEANVRWPGHYYECRDAIGPKVRGQYCAAYYGFLYYPRPNGIPIDVTKGICFPSICSESTTRMLYRIYFTENNTIPLMTVRCSQNLEWSTLDTIGICIVAVLLLLAFTGLVVDLLKRAQKKSCTSRDDQNNGPFDSIPIQMILSFSPLSNAEKILDTTQRRGTLPVLDGIRFISTTWVILGHTLQMMFYGIDNSIRARKRITSDPSFQVIINATVAVDTFFLLSGLLVAYLGMKHLHRTKGSMNIPLMYLQRYLRLTPLYAFMILFSMGLYKFFGAGPAWKDYVDGTYYACENNWWTNLVYINNIYPATNYCYGVAWYLANDMQFYLLAPFFLIILYRWRVVGIVLVSLVIVGGMITNGVLSSLNEIQPSAVGLAFQLTLWFRIFYHSVSPQTYENKFSTDIYFTPWARINVYMIGMLTGYILFVAKGKVKMHKIVVVIGWIIAAGWALGIIYGLYGYVKDMTAMPVDLAAFYNAVNRPIWGICVAWVIIACSSGYGGPVTTFLNWKVFTPLSRLTYSAYLCHLLILYWYGATQEQFMHFSTTNMTYIFLGTLIITFGWAFVISIFIEWPFIGLFKVIFSPLTKPKSKDQNPRIVPQPTELHEAKVEEDISKPPSYSSEISESTTNEDGHANKAFENEKSTVTEM